MKTFLQELVSLKVIEAKVVFDYLQVFFEGGTGLNVYNKYQITAPDGHFENEQRLVGAIVSKVYEGKEAVRLTFSNGLELLVDMSAGAYLGPEAMELIRPGLPIIIWRPDN